LTKEAGYPVGTGKACSNEKSEENKCDCSVPAIAGRVYSKT